MKNSGFDLRVNFILFLKYLREECDQGKNQFGQILFDEEQ
jgi:hypothetical protein